MPIVTHLLHIGSMKEQRAKADDLRRNGRFEEAAHEYAALWPDGDRWTGWGYAHCLRKLGRTSEALGVAREVQALAPDFRFGRSVYAWALYDQTRGTDILEPQHFAAAKTIVDLMTSDEHAYTSTTPYVVTVLRVAEAWSDRRRDVRALEWLDKLDPTRLSTEPRSQSDETGRTRELASARERYYSVRTRALERLDRWKDCLDVANRGLVECHPLHHDNDIWFRRRIALAKLHMGHPQDALADLEQLAARKPVSFIQTDIAEAAWAAGDIERTYKHALQALQAPGEIHFKLGAVQLLARVLWHRREPDLARLHLALCLAVRGTMGWKPSDDLTTLGAQWSVDQAHRDPTTILKELRSLWQRWNEELTPRRVGTVVRMFPHGRAGFIRSDDRQEFFFDARDCKSPRFQPAEGTRVTFITRPGFDRKRQRSTIVACDVRTVLSAS